MLVSAPRRLLTRLRQVMASDAAPLEELARLLAAELVSEVCSIYVMRAGEILELAATHGLNPAAVGRTRLRVGEGIVGLCAARQEVLNLADAQNHPAFAYRAETGEEPFASMIAVPVRRAGRMVGVLVAQNRNPRQYSEDEVDVLETVSMLLAELLAAAGAADSSDEGVAATVPRSFSGSVLGGGIVIGPVFVRGGRPTINRLLADDPAAELQRLNVAADRMQRGLDELIANTHESAPAVGAASREVLAAYRLVAADAGWLRRVGDVIRSGVTAEAAVARVAGEVRDRMRRITDPYLRERLADLDELADRLLLALIDPAMAGGPARMPADPIPPGSILLARRLGPADLLDWHAKGVAGVAIEEASPAGHAAIVARALGLPALGGVRGVVEAARSGDLAVLDADEGRLILRPDSDVRQIYARALETRTARQAVWAGFRDRKAVTADGTPIRLMLNVGLGLELDQIATTGADGIGLYRSEIAMLARGAVAEVAEQAATYAKVLDAAGDRPVLFRTLDLGADKILPGAVHTAEENPAMGWRSLRIGLDRPALLRRQLRALLLAAGGRDLSVMFPMVATVAEFSAARALLEAEARRVRPTPRTLRIGTMLEVPALLWQLPVLLEQADFVSIGSNDLLQFVFAADRGTPAIAHRYDLLSQPMFDLLEQVLRAAANARGGQGVPVSLCGEAAGRPLEALALVGLGLTTLSMPASGILPIKAMLSQLDLVSFRPVLTAIRHGGAGIASLREPIASWAREHGLPI
jgi:phosphotransferase system enzyme I (PtsP)